TIKVRGYNASDPLRAYVINPTEAVLFRDSQRSRDTFVTGVSRGNRMNFAYLDRELRPKLFPAFRFRTRPTNGGNVGNPTHVRALSSRRGAGGGMWLALAACVDQDLRFSSSVRALVGHRLVSRAALLGRGAPCRQSLLRLKQPTPSTLGFLRTHFPTVTGPNPFTGSP